MARKYKLGAKGAGFPLNFLLRPMWVALFLSVTFQMVSGQYSLFAFSKRCCRGELEAHCGKQCPMQAELSSANSMSCSLMWPHQIFWFLLYVQNTSQKHSEITLHHKDSSFKQQKEQPEIKRKAAFSRTRSCRLWSASKTRGTYLSRNTPKSVKAQHSHG